MKNFCFCFCQHAIRTLADLMQFIVYVQDDKGPMVAAL
jgi:hypothetical protein